LRWQCPVQFDAEEDSVTFAQTLLATRLRQPDPVLRKTLEAHALSQLALLDTDTDLTSKVKQSIRNSSPMALPARIWSPRIWG